MFPVIDNFAGGSTISDVGKWYITVVVQYVFYNSSAQRGQHMRTQSLAKEGGS